MKFDLATLRQAAKAALDAAAYAEKPLTAEASQQLDALKEQLAPTVVALLAESANDSARAAQNRQYLEGEAATVAARAAELALDAYYHQPGVWMAAVQDAIGIITEALKSPVVAALIQAAVKAAPLALAAAL